jgi:hypothetical protein
MKTKQADQTAAKPGKVWQPTQVCKFNPLRSIRHIFCTIAHSWQAHSSKFENRCAYGGQAPVGRYGKNERESVAARQSASKGRMTFGDCVGIFKTQTEASNLLTGTMQ